MVALRRAWSLGLTLCFICGPKSVRTMLRGGQIWEALGQFLNAKHALAMSRITQTAELPKYPRPF